ncbi:MAG TPA: type II toxin-antitoxin system VapC family toxin [Tangfeifania sp.]|nr:type II toxin-antitoxin system VapC family toxin [Tangfeifania sp.]
MDKALIDTDILSYYFKGDAIVVNKFQKYLENYETIEISIITYYEIMSGLLAKNAFKQLAVFEDFISANIVVPLTNKSSEISAEIYSSLKQSGKIIDDIDILIAGIAIENDYVLITNNTRHFSRMNRLRIKNWKE